VGTAAKRGYAYQHQICPWHAYSPSTNTIEEWSFAGVEFDGLDAAQCHLYEAKHGYDGFLRTEDWSANGRPTLQPWYDRSDIMVFEEMYTEAENQARAVSQHYPNAKLTWVFSSGTTQVFVFEAFLDRGLVPPIESKLEPFSER
jgi:hypothetical protein